MDGIEMDGVKYHVRVVFDTLDEGFSIREGPNADNMMSGLKERDLIGTYYSHTMRVEPDPHYPEDFDSLYNAIRMPVPFHLITMPDNQDTVTYKAMVSSGTRRYKGRVAGRRIWKGLTVYFESIEPVLPAQ